MLIAMPSMSDERFSRALIYLFSHSDDGAMGLVINRRSKVLTFPELLVQLELVDKAQAVHLPASAKRVPVLAGGPVESGRGFVLHSSDFCIPDSTIVINDAISLTITMDMLRALASGKGPSRAILALGYAGWSSGQLESEIQANVWLHAPADPELLFGSDLDIKYDRALRALGIEPAFFSAEAGHA